MKFALKSPIAIIFIICLVETQIPPPNELRFSKILDDSDKYILFWDFDATHIYFEVMVNTTGWIGFGISPAGRMYPADMALGWVKDGQVYLGDYHTKLNANGTAPYPYSAPEMDFTQDYQLEYGYEENGTTTLRFTRKLDTCDPNGEDFPITGDTMYVIYAYHNEDPFDNGTIQQHESVSRGAKPILFLNSPSYYSTVLPHDAQTIDFRARNVRLPPVVDFYYCIVFNLTEYHRKIQFTKFEPVIAQGNEHAIYSLFLYRCHTHGYDKQNLHGNSYRCEQAPDFVKACEGFVAGWIQGGEAFHLPENVGFSAGDYTDPGVYVLSIHYINPGKRADIVDNSGLRLTFTSTPRPNEGAFLRLGNIISRSWYQYIPPEMEKFTSRAYCSSRCLDWGFLGTNGSIWASAVIFHSRRRGRAMKLRHFRDGIELPYIAVDKRFNPHYQLNRMLNPVEIGRNDTLLLECTYNTTRDKKPIKGGYAKDEEICWAVLFYYPKKSIDACLSWSSYDTLRDPQGRSIARKDAIKYLRDFPWQSDAATASIADVVQDSIFTSEERAYCSSSEQFPSVGLDKFRQPATANIGGYEEPPSPCTTPV